VSPERREMSYCSADLDCQDHHQIRFQGNLTLSNTSGLVCMIVADAHQLCGLCSVLMKLDEQVRELQTD
jgi:hypothetical protein